MDPAQVGARELIFSAHYCGDPKTDRFKKQGIYKTEMKANGSVQTEYAPLIFFPHKSDSTLNSLSNIGGGRN